MTRPTLDRVREALFSILGDIAEQSVVDLYAGSGALGLEALSRGARHVTLVEADRQAAQVIRKNAAAWGVPEQFTVLECNVERARASLSARAPFNLVLSDPPWKIAVEAGLAVQRLVSDLLAPEAVVVLGHATRDELQLVEGSDWIIDSRRTWGDSALSFLRRSG